MSEFWYTSALFALGTIIGSFLNVVILRQGIEEKSRQLPGTLRGRSRCPSCGNTLSPVELIPLVSYLLQRGRCRTCSIRIYPQYPLVELTCGLLAVALLAPLLVGGGGESIWPGLMYPHTSLLRGEKVALALLDFIAACVLIILFVVDLKTFILPDKFLWPLAAVTISHAAIRMINYELGVAMPLWGAALGGGFLLFLYLVTRGRGIGFGDVKLLVPLGFCFGPLGTATLLFLSFIAGGAYGSALLAARRATMKTAIPFGPFLIGAALLLMQLPELPRQLLHVLGWPL